MQKIISFAAFCLLIFGAAQKAAAQPKVDEVAAIILHQDSLFWKAYNACDAAAMERFFTDDMEFYHDKGGETKELAVFAANVKKGLCGNPDFRLRRVAVTGSVQTFPMAKNGIVYGAIISGSHNFYVAKKGEPEFLDGLARFTHLWLLKDGVWKMSRVLSYDHGPAVR